MAQVLVFDMLKCVTFFFFDFNPKGSASIDLYQGEGWFSLFTDPIRQRQSSMLAKLRTGESDLSARNSTK